MIKACGVRFFSTCLLILFGCSTGNIPPDTSNVIARVGNETLTTEDLSGLNLGNNAQDSLTLLASFANKWIEEQVLYQRAQKELAANSSAFEKQLEAYKKSLFIYSFQQQLVGESMDTVISEDAIESYYRENEKHFLLKTDIIKFRLAIFPLKTKLSAKIKSLFVDASPKKSATLESVLRVKAKSFFLNDTSWTSVLDVSKLLPVEFNFGNERLSKNTLIEFQDSSGLNLLWIRDVKMKKSISPLEFEIPRIRAILLHQKKQIFLKDLERKWVQEALTEKNAELYVGNSNP